MPEAAFRLSEQASCASRAIRFERKRMRATGNRNVEVCSILGTNSRSWFPEEIGEARKKLLALIESRARKNPGGAGLPGAAPVEALAFRPATDAADNTRASAPVPRHPRSQTGSRLRGTQ